MKCELFLNFIVFDEHTCQASALVCWGEARGAGNARLERARASASRSQAALGQEGASAAAEIQLRSQGTQPLTI